MKDFILKEIFDDAFDLNRLSSNPPFTQALFYLNWQRKIKRKSRRFLVLDEAGPVAYFQMIKYHLIFGKSYFYIPYGPIIKDVSEDLLSFLKKEIYQIAKEEKVIFVRLDFSPKIDSNVLSRIFKRTPKTSYHSAYFQPRDEWYLDITKDEKILLENMHKNTRYSIRASEKRSVVVEIVEKDFEKYFDSFFEIMKDTANRDGFSLHSREYYKIIFDSLSQIDDSFLSVARFQGKILTIDLFISFGKVVHYVFSASSSEERERFSSYLALWQAILHAKKKGFNLFNFGGISGDNIEKGWQGITNFKKKFGGFHFRHSDFFDIVIKWLWYYAYISRKFFQKILSRK